MSSNSPQNRWVIPIGAVLVHVCIGSVYAWSTFNRPIQALFPDAPWWFTPPYPTFTTALALLGLSAAFGGPWVERRGPRAAATAAALFFGTGLLIGGLGLFLLKNIDARSGPLDIIIPLSIMAFGMGFGMSQRTSIIAAVVPTSEVGVASSILALVRNIAGAFGISVFATILSSATESSLADISRYSIINTLDPLMRAKAAVLMTLQAEIDGFRVVFIAAALLMALAAVVVIFTLNVRELKSGVEVFVE